MNSNDWHGDPEQARANNAQQLLLPNTPRAACEQMGLNWWAALKLWDGGWLSFNPDATPHLDDAQEAELRFIGSLVIGGCNTAMLTALLGGLRKPYSYDGSRLYYDWSANRWRLWPERRVNPEAL